VTRNRITLDGEAAVAHKFILSTEDSEEFKEHARAQTLPFGTLVRVVIRDFLRRNSLNTEKAET
jgi:hypothetical protein